MRFILDCVYLVAIAAISPMVIYRIIRQGRYHTGWAQRLGQISRRHPEKKCIWFHAVSVGEVNATKTIVPQLKGKFDDFEIVISTTTDTGFARAKALYGNEYEVFYFPLDLSFIMYKAFKNLRPAVCLLMELEVWPNFTSIAEQLNIPVVVLNGRLSDKSSARYKKIRPIVKKIFQKVNLVLAQTDQYAERFKYLGCAPEKVFVTGSLKYDTAQIADKVQGAEKLARALALDKEKLWVAGATGPGEEKIILQVYQKLKQQDRCAELRLAIVPRKPERFDEAAQLIRQAGLTLVRYSLIKTAETAGQASITDKQAVILGDTMGDLRKFYSLATIVFVGRSLVPMGGSDMIEAAALGKCTIFGPHTFNFKQTVDALLAEDGALMVKDAQELLQMVQKCLLEPDFAQKTAHNGQEVIRKNQGATDRTIQQIAKFLNTA